MKLVKGKRGRGRPPISPGERSVPVTVRFPPSEYDRLDKFARENHTTIPELIRNIPAAFAECAAIAQAAEAERDTYRDILIAERSARATNEETWATLIRLLSAKAQTPDTVSAVLLFLEQHPNDIHALGVRRTLEWFQQTKARDGLTDDDLWSILQHGPRWREMRELKSKFSF